MDHELWRPDSTDEQIFQCCLVEYTWEQFSHHWPLTSDNFPHFIDFENYHNLSDKVLHQSSPTLSSEWRLRVLQQDIFTIGSSPLHAFLLSTLIWNLAGRPHIEDFDGQANFVFAATCNSAKSWSQMLFGIEQLPTWEINQHFMSSKQLWIMRLSCGWTLLSFLPRTTLSLESSSQSKV